MTENACGSCGVCCKIPPILELNKPDHTWCGYYNKGIGCSIYQHRPAPCKDFQCAWIRNVSEGLLFWSDVRFRPDRSKVFCREFTRNGRMILWLYAYDPMHPKALEEPLVQTWIKRALDCGYVVEAATKVGGKPKTVTYDRTISA